MFYSNQQLEDEALLLLAAVLLAGPVVLLHTTNLADELEERLLDVDTGLGRRLQEGDSEGLGKLLTLGSRDLTLRLQIALVSADHDGDGIGVLDTENLFAERGDLLKRRARRDGIHTQEPFACPHVLVTHGRVLLLPSSVEDVEEARLLVDNHLLPVRILNRGVCVCVWGGECQCVAEGGEGGGEEECGGGEERYEQKGGKVGRVWNVRK